MRVLIIDDDEQIRRLLSLALSNIGWIVDEASDGETGLRLAAGGRPDVILLDINLPDMAGGAVLAAIRAWSMVPVIVVSVRDSETDISGLLNAGADDYVVKPFHTGELVSRMKAVRRRSAPESIHAFRSGSFEVDFERHRVSMDGVESRLTPTEFSILELLVRHPGKIVTRSRMLKQLWGPMGEVEEGSLRVHIASLRKKIEPSPSTPSIIVTEPGIGYRFALEPDNADS
ncbi:MAG TPA: response regulator transcription factor [bacterium]|nr:response regulator transcription factor [bacterium]